MSASSSEASVFTLDSRWFPPRYRGRVHRHALDRNRWRSRPGSPCSQSKSRTVKDDMVQQAREDELRDETAAKDQHTATRPLGGDRVEGS